MGKIDLWAGIECTVNRVKDTFFDQLRLNGHWERVSDLDLFASLPIRKIRYPVLWEHVAPHNPLEQDWAWARERLGKLRDLNIDPIVGLVHHGSGPRYTSLADPGFAQGLARHARGVAEHFPWVQHYTPVNEPLTTARFSGLYGLWYPHAKDPASFIRMLLHQTQATKLAMAAIREVNPSAKLVQTEDLGKVQSTPLLAYQADFENERRWLSFDLLCGKVDRHHALWHYIRSVGITEQEILPFAESPLPPDIMGINHYVTSERFLDHNFSHYPPHCHGHNGQHRYADVETIRVGGATSVGPKKLLLEAWERYGIPIAVTETHLSCTHEEQVRWFQEIYEAASSLEQGGEAHIVAVTAWALLGAYNWNSLLTQDAGYYESGVFDLRAPNPRPTALAHHLRTLGSTGIAKHPVLQAKGWWQRSDRYAYTCLPDGKGAASLPPASAQQPPANKPILITGATGTLGNAFRIICAQRGLTCVLTDRAALDIADPDSVAAAIRHHKPWAIINTAGYVRVEEAETDVDQCYRENTDGPALLAEVCAKEGIRLVTFSSDLVFNGTKKTPYTESDIPAPLNVYGASKAAAEKQVLAAFPDALIIRTSAFFGPWDEHNFIYHAVRALRAGEPFLAAADVVVSPTYVPDLVHTTLDLLLDAEKGIWHLANSGSYSWAELAGLAAKIGQLHNDCLEALPVSHWQRSARQPAYSVLQSERGWLMPPVEHALHRYFKDASPLLALLEKQQAEEPVETLETGPKDGDRERK